MTIARTPLASGRAWVWWLGGLAGVGFVLAVSGVLAPLAFQQVSQAKWALTAGFPAAGVMLALTRFRVTYMAMALIFMLPFVPLVYTLGPVPISGTYLLLGVAVVVAAITNDVVPRTRRQRSTVPIAASIAFVALLPSTVAGAAIGERLGQFLCLAALGYVVCRASAIDSRAPRLMVAGVALSGALQGYVAVREFTTRIAFNPYGGGVASYSSNYFFGYAGDIRPAAAFFDPNSLGNALAIALPLAVAGAASAKNSLVLRALQALSAVVITAGLTLTLSRMSWVGAGVGVIVVVLLHRGFRRVQLAAGVLLGAVVTVAFAAGVAGSQLLERFNSISDPTGNGVITADGDRTRQQLWAATVTVIKEHWVLGTGFGRLNPYLVQTVAGSGIFTHAHSTYLQYAAEAGALGVLALGVVLSGAIADLVRRWRCATGQADRLWAGYGGAVVAMLVCWTTDYTITYPAVMLSMAIPFALLAADRMPVALETVLPRYLAERIP